MSCISYGKLMIILDLNNEAQSEKKPLPNEQEKNLYHLQWHKMTTQLSTIDFLKKEEVKQKFQEILGKNATTFMTTVMSLVAQNKMLQDADPQSVYMSAMTSASL